jgi:hypothetical protein
MAAVFIRETRMNLRRESQIRDKDARTATRQRPRGRRTDTVIRTGDESNVIAKNVRRRIHSRRS